MRTLTGPVGNAADANTAAWRRAEIGAANGHATAAGVLRVMRTLSLGGINDGHRLLSEKTIDLVFDQQSEGVDLVLGVPLRMGIGFGLPQLQTVPWIPEGRICFWGGWGGSMIIMDLDRRLTISYAMNRMGPGIVGSDRAAAYVSAVYASVG